MAEKKNKDKLTSTTLKATMGCAIRAQPPNIMLPSSAILKIKCKNTSWLKLKVNQNFAELSKTNTLNSLYLLQ